MFCEELVFKNYILRLKEKILSWRDEKILLYGAGIHSEALLNEIAWGKNLFLGFIDRSEKKQAEGFLGYKVFPSDAIKKIGATKIVISSFSFQEEIFKTLSDLAFADIELVKLYTEEDFLSFIKKRYALTPKNGLIRSDLIENRTTYMNSPSQEGYPKILLIQAPFQFGNHRHKKILPMNLLYLASFALKESPKASISILDGQVHDLSIEEMKILITTETWDIIGIGYWTGQATGVFELSRFIRQNTKALLIHGGVHPTLCPEESVCYCDIVVKNEGEEIFSEIVKAFPDKSKIHSISGIAYQEKGNLQTTPPRSPIENLDTLPFPAFHLIPDIKKYNAPMHVTGGLRVPLIGSRGCPYSCTFCSSPVIWDKRVRWRSPENVVAEMSYVINTLGITQFHFWDDNVMMKKDYMAGICENIISRKLQINWCGLTRASHVIKHKDILHLMKKAGCVGIEIGIESFTEDSAEMISKGEGVSETIYASKCMEENGIAPLYTHMLFNPGERINGYREKQKFLDEVNKKNTAFLADSRLGQASTPHRKTKFEKEAKEQGDVFLKDHSTYVHHRVNFIPNSLLNDIPVKIESNPDSPIKFLEIILQAIFDWDETMIDKYIEVSTGLWEKIDNKKSVRLLCDEIGRDLNLPFYYNRIFTTLAIVGMAREGKIRSSGKPLQK